MQPPLETPQAFVICKNCNKQHTNYVYEVFDFPKEGHQKHVYSIVCLPRKEILATLTFIEPMKKEQTEINNNITNMPEGQIVKRGRGRPRKVI